MLFEADICRETVSIFEAVLLGTNGACIDLSLASLLGGVALFITGVVVLRYVAILALRRVFPSLRRKNSAPLKAPDTLADALPEEGLQRLPYESPIRTIKSWGSKTR